MEILSSARHQGPQRRGASPGTLPHGGAGTDDVRHLAGTGTSPAAEHRQEGPSWHVAKEPTAHGQRGRQKPWWQLHFSLLGESLLGTGRPDGGLAEGQGAARSLAFACRGRAAP